jgi:hypothetical protein
VIALLRAALLASATLAAASALVGCAPEPVAPESPPIARVWVSRCGSCHTRVEPGSRSRDHLEDALKRHHRRVRLSGDEWTQLVDYLAKRDATAAVDSPAPSTTTTTH